MSCALAGITPADKLRLLGLLLTHLEGAGEGWLPHRLSVTPHFKPRGPGIRESTWMRGEGPGSAINTFGLYVPAGIGPLGHAGWISKDWLQPGRTPGLLSRGGSRGLGIQGFGHCRMARVSLALQTGEMWCPKQEAPTQWLLGELAAGNGHGEPGSLTPSYRDGSWQAPDVGIGRTQRSRVGQVRFPYTVPSYPERLLVPVG